MTRCCLGSIHKDDPSALGDGERLGSQSINQVPASARAMKMVMWEWKDCA